MQKGMRVVVGMLAGAVLATALTGAEPAPAAEGGFSFQEVEVSSPLGQPCNVASAPDGSLWFVEHGAVRLARLDLETGAITKFVMPRRVSAPFVGAVTPTPSVVPLGPCDMEFSESGDKLFFNHQAANSIGWIRTSPPHEIYEVELSRPMSVPMSLARGADGMLYVTATGADQIVKIDPGSMQMEAIPLQGHGSGIIGGTAGRDGAHWFVEQAGNKLLRMDYQTRELREHTIPTPLSAPFVIRWYDGALWFSEFAANAIGRFDPKSGEFDEITLPTPASFPIGLVQGRDGHIYTEGAASDNIVEIDPSTRQVVAEYPLPSKHGGADEMKVGPDGALWVTLFFHGKLVRFWKDDFGPDPGFPQKGGQVSGATDLADDLQNLNHTGVGGDPPG